MLERDYEWDREGGRDEERKRERWNEERERGGEIKREREGEKQTDTQRNRHKEGILCHEDFFFKTLN